MGMKMREVVYSPPAKQILAIPDHYVAIGFKHAKATSGTPGLAVSEGGRYIIKAGTIYPANDSTAIGVILNDYDATDGDVMMAVVVHGFVKTSALPAVPAAAAVSALKDIQFLPYTPLNMTFTATMATAKNGQIIANIVGTGSLTLTNATFRSNAGVKADIATNWTISDTADADIDEVTISEDGKTATFKFKLAATKSSLKTGNLTVLPGAHIISTGRTLTTAAKVLDVTAT